MDARGTVLVVNLSEKKNISPTSGNVLAGTEGRAQGNYGTSSIQYRPVQKVFCMQILQMVYVGMDRAMYQYIFLY